MLDRRLFRALKEGGSRQYIYDRRRVCHDTCVEKWRRRRGVLVRNRTILLAGVLTSDALSVQCEEEVLYCQKLSEGMQNPVYKNYYGGGRGAVVFQEIVLKIAFVLRRRLRNCVLELKLQQYSAV